MTIECQHGQLARACELCTLETRVMELEAEKVRLLTMLKELSGAVQLDMVSETYPRKVLFVMAKLTEELEA